MRSSTYYGQNPEGFTHIGTDELKFPLKDWDDLDKAVAELRRRCGKRCDIKLFAEVDSDGDR